MKIRLDFDAFEPTRAHRTDAGLDLRAKHSGVVRAHGSMTFGTGVHVQLPKGTAGLLLPRSGMMVNRDLLTFGVVDESYRGEIKVHIFNHGDEEYIVRPGDRITQMVIVPVVCEPVEIVDALDDGERMNAGFGSTGA